MEAPRRNRIDLYTPAEKAIYDAMQAVEGMEPDERLTKAVMLLGQAQNKVADFIDKPLKPKEFDISMVVYQMDNKYSEEEVNDMFIDWVESKGMYCGGSVKEIINKDRPTNPSSKAVE